MLVQYVVEGVVKEPKCAQDKFNLLPTVRGEKNVECLGPKNSVWTGAFYAFEISLLIYRTVALT